LIKALNPKFGSALSIGARIAISLILSILSTYLLEQPILKWSKKFYKKVGKQEIKTIDFV
jgi:peptidoglycan/LPS O-acetylase OafA/YrhL